MAGGGNHHLSVVTVNKLETVEWEISVARFFTFPKSISSSASSNLRPLPKSKARLGGTWISSESTAHLRLITNPTNPETILNVSLRGKVIEEHFTCNLHFSWPQVSCVTQCPTRGSRVIFASYRDSDGQIQKFALRFASACDAQSFIDTIRVKPIPLAIEHQDISKDAMGCSRPNSGVGHELSSQSDFGSSNAVQYRDQLSFMDLVEDYSPQTISPLMSYNSEQKPCSQESFPEGLPPSFTALLTNCCAEVEKGGAVPGEIDLKTQIIKYMSDASFHDMLAKVEEVMLEIGGDLAL